MTMAAIGRQTPPNLTSKSFSIWGGQITRRAAPLSPRRLHHSSPPPAAGPKSHRAGSACARRAPACSLGARRVRARGGCAEHELNVGRPAEPP